MAGRTALVISPDEPDGAGDDEGVGKIEGKGVGKMDGDGRAERVGDGLGRIEGEGSGDGDGNGSPTCLTRRGANGLRGDRNVDGRAGGAVDDDG